MAAPQLGVGLRVFTFDVDDVVGHLVNPVLDFPDDEEQDGPEGCLSIPGLYFDTKRRLNVVAKGFNEYGDPMQIVGTGLMARCVQHETDHLDGVLFVDRLDPQRRKEAMREIRQAEWYDLDNAAGGEAEPALDQQPLRSGAVTGMRLVFAGTPAVAVPALDAIAASGHELVAVVTRPDAPAGRGRGLVRSPVGAWADERGIEVLTPARPRDPEFLQRLREIAPDCVPVVAYGALVPPVGAGDPAPRLGQPALLAAARLARRGPRAARRAPRRRGHRRQRLPAGGRAWTPARSSAR